MLIYKDHHKVYNAESWTLRMIFNYCR